MQDGSGELDFFKIQARRFGHFGQVIFAFRKVFAG